MLNASALAALASGDGTAAADISCRRFPLAAMI
jgi:hypothetical protein